MGLEMTTMTYLAFRGNQNELERKGIPVDAPNTPDGQQTSTNMPQVTQRELLQYGEEVLEKMQDEQLKALKLEHERIGSKYDRTMEDARMR